MKLCITATGNTLEAQTDPSFGRAPWLILVDTDTLAFEAVENTGVNASQGAGIAAAQMISDRDADALLTGRVGPKARAALESAGIAIYEGIAAGTVRNALSTFNSGMNASPATGISQPRTTQGPAAAGAGQGRGRGGRGKCSGSGMGRGSGGRCRSNIGPGGGQQRRGR